ncbi:MAG: hypothetical protein O2967_11520 [Proteobacteria bacterium]|nr:hypothetical protein [Pseudomonadota bacterium]
MRCTDRRILENALAVGSIRPGPRAPNRSPGNFPTFGRYVESFLTAAIAAAADETYAERVGPLLQQNSDDIHVNVQLVE